MPPFFSGDSLFPGMIYQTAAVNFTKVDSSFFMPDDRIFHKIVRKNEKKSANDLTKHSFRLKV